MRERNMGVMATMWVGGELDWLSRVCLKSAVRQGHDVHLYSYRDVPNLPAGVTHRDARTVIPEGDIFRFDGILTPKTFGSYAPFSDVFRYRMMYLDLGTWIDSDVYFVRPLDTDRPTLLCWEQAASGKPDEDKIGNAVMRLPANSRILRDLVAITRKPYRIPPWVSKDLQTQALEKLAGRPFFPGAVSYATYGPNAVTYFATKRGLTTDVQSFEQCYPVGWRDVGRFGQPDAEFIESLPSTTATIHLWNSRFSVVFARNIPKDSFAARLREESLDA